MSSDFQPPPPPFPATIPHTKVIATIGPASEGRIGEMIEAGMSVARINLSHGTEEDFLRRVALIRREADARMRAVGILTDIPGPKMRMGRFAGGVRTLRDGERLRLRRRGAGVAKQDEVELDFDGFLEAVRPGHRVILADGQAELVAETIESDAIVARVSRAGDVGDRKGVHFPDSKLAYDLPSEHDKKHLALANEAGVDMIGASFVSRPDEIRAIRALVPGLCVIAKIERMAALANIDAILGEADGIMVARGDLGVEAELEQLPLIQKSLIASTLRAGKFAITATEMLESMVDSSRPTRAEVTDVANAVLDGSDAVMLSAETAVGEHPVEAVATMARIARAVETSQRYQDLPRPTFRISEANFGNATALAAVQAAEALGITKIVCFTETGNSVRQVSRYRPSAEVFALSPHLRTVNQMTVLAHVRPMLFRRERSLEEMLHMASEMLLVRGMARAGDAIVFVAGVPPGISRTTNVMKLHHIGEEVKLH
ncbi:MAG TPA: pyruvate kinase [Planctomycetota bacterium]|jgi:pyruvate kinase|nr:pyruvate kinase [Planctomycetota bacterium]